MSALQAELRIGTEVPQAVITVRPALFGQMPFQGLVKSVSRFDLFQFSRQLDLIGLLACSGSECDDRLAFLSALADRA